MSHAPPSKPSALSKKAGDALHQAAMAYPQTRTDHPWGETVVKVAKKGFLFMRVDGEGLSASFKLPESNAAALAMPFAQPTGYGMGKSGWVTVKFGPKEAPPVPLLKQWLDESFRAVAPKTLLKNLSSK